VGRPDRESTRSPDSGPTREGDLETTRSSDLESRRHEDLEPVRRGDLDSANRNDGDRAALEVGEEVLITGGIFEGQTGVVEGVLPSGKLRVAVETRRSLASARVNPAHLERLGILVEGTEETG
jgi:transcription antitermination factor NusG